MKKEKVRIHNEFFSSIKGGKCPSCGSRKNPELISWGEYSRGKFYSLKKVCFFCFVENVLIPLRQHRKPCGCVIMLVSRSGCSVPAWFKPFLGELETS